MDKNITWFDIPMHDIVLNQHLECFKQILKIRQRPLLTQIPILLNQRLQCTTITVLVDKVHIVSSFQYLDKLHNMSGILDFG